MTKSEIEKLIEHLDNAIPKRAFDERFHDGEKFVDKGVQVYCKVNDAFDALRAYRVEPEEISDKLKVSLFLDGDMTPLNLVKALVDSRLLGVDELTEVAAYLEVYADHHSDGGFLR